MEIEHQYKQQMIAKHGLFRTVPIFRDKANPKMRHSGLEDQHQNLTPVTLSGKNYKCGENAIAVLNS